MTISTEKLSDHFEEYLVSVISRTKIYVTIQFHSGFDLIIVNEMTSQDYFDKLWPDPSDVVSPAEPLVMCEYCNQLQKEIEHAEFNCLTCKMLVCSTCKSEHKIIANKNTKHDIVIFLPIILKRNSFR